MLRIPLAHGFRFSLRTFLATLMLLSLISSNLYVSFKWRQAQREVQRLRDELGYLIIDDPTRFYVRELPTREPLSWRWRIYVPPGERIFYAAGGGIHETGTRTSGNSLSGTSGPILYLGHSTSPAMNLMQGEYTLEARIERNRHGSWRVAVSAPQWRHTHEMTPAETAWLSDDEDERPYLLDREVAVKVAGADRQTASFATEDTVVLLRVRAPTAEQTATHEPCDGVMIWFEPIRAAKTRSLDSATPSKASE